MKNNTFMILLSILGLTIITTSAYTDAQDLDKILPPAGITDNKAEGFSEMEIKEGAGVNEIEKMQVPPGLAIDEQGKEKEAAEVGIEEEVELREREDIVDSIPRPYTKTIKIPKVESGREPSTIELLYLGKISEKKQILEQFGYEIFGERLPASIKGQRILSTIPPAGIDKDYILAPGDEIQIFLSGEGVTVYRDRGGAAGGKGELHLSPIIIDQDGKIYYPPAGTLFLWGMKIAEAEQYLRSELEKYIKDVQVSISLRKVRSFPVIVVGEVVRSGMTIVNAYSTVMDALILGSGVKKTGSLRKISVKRNDNSIAEFDLYGLLLRGERKDDVLLKDRDVIVVPPIGNTIAVKGMVKRPGIFEIKEGETLADVFLFAGGMLPGANVFSLKLATSLADGKKIIREVNLDQSGVEIKDGDVLTVVPLADELKEFVELRGHVKNPGFYQWREGMSVKDILESEENFLPEGLFNYAELVRRSPPDYSPQILSFNASQALAGEPSQDKELNQGDVITIYSIWDFRKKPFVRVEGEVENPGRYRWAEKMTVRDLLITSGGLTRASRLDDAELWRYNLEEGRYVLKFMRRLDLGGSLEGDPEENPELMPFDQLVIKGVGSFEQLIWKTTVKGEVTSPGTFPIKRGDRISDLIERAGGLTKFSYARGIVLLRKSVEELQRKRLRVLIAELESSLFKEEAASALGAETGEIALRKQVLESRKELLRVMKEKMELVVGRIVVDIDKDLDIIRGTDRDIELEDGDELFIPSVPAYVLMMGDVFNQVGLTYKHENKLNDYLFEVGGLTKNADKDGIYIIRADGTVVSNEAVEFVDMVHWDSRKNRFSSGGLNLANIYPGDTIVVPTETKFPIPWRPLIKDITQIIFQSLSTVAIIDSLND